VFSNVCTEYDVILVFFVVNEIEHDGKQDKGTKVMINYKENGSMMLFLEYMP
jgi:hypothetical protein